MKEEHVLLADFSHLFTDKLIALGISSLKDPSVERPSFMNKVVFFGKESTVWSM